MTFRRSAPIFFATIATLAFMLIGFGCVKEEYSYEGGLLPPVDSTTDTTTQNIPPPFITACKECSPGGPAQYMQWHFLCEASALCGPVTKAVMSPDKNAITFFGPSTCSVDTGLIMSAFFDEPLNSDRSNVKAARAVLQYYIKNAADNVFQSEPPHPFTLTIDQYTLNTRIAMGHFDGFAYTPAGKQVAVNSGTFYIYFE